MVTGHRPGAAAHPARRSSPINRPPTRTASSSDTIPTGIEQLIASVAGIRYGITEATQRTPSVPSSISVE